MVSSPPLYLGHIINYTTHTTQISTVTIRGPISDMEEIHLMCIARLGTTNIVIIITLAIIQTSEWVVVIVLTT